MPHLLLAFAGEKTRQHMQNIFESAGMRVTAACGSGAELLRRCAGIDGGAVLAGFKLLDMTAEELRESLPERFSLVLLAPQSQLDTVEREEIIRLQAPARKSELLGTVRLLLSEEEPAPHPGRSDEDRALIEQAKALLMARNQMTESQAHRFLQKRSMDTGARMVQTALMVLDGQLIL